MIPRIHKVGSSFKGCAAYLLHDKDSADSAERVSWVEMHNLGTSNPATGWRVMAATALNQNALKQAAGLRASGNKSKGSVLHYSLSWEEGAEGLSKEEMLRAAKASLAVYGVDPETSKAKKKPARRQFADEHQAMIICHTDEKHPHVHIMVNRVHPVHGAILPNSNDRTKLSDWALEYEKSRGEVLCKQREINHDMRQRGLWVKGAGNLPRNAWDMTRDTLGKAANDSAAPALLRLKAEQKAKNDALAHERGAMARGHASAWRELGERFKSRQRDLKAACTSAIATAKAGLVKAYTPRFSMLQKRHDLTLKAFQADEGGMRTKAGNVWESMKLLSKIRGESAEDFHMRDVFAPFAGAGARLDILKRAQGLERRVLEKEIDQKISIETDKARAELKAGKSENTERYKVEKADLLLSQNMDKAALKTKWNARSQEQRGAYAEFAAKQEQREDFKNEYVKAMLADGGLQDILERDQTNEHSNDDERER